MSDRYSNYGGGRGYYPVRRRRNRRRARNRVIIVCVALVVVAALVGGGFWLSAHKDGQASSSAPSSQGEASAAPSAKPSEPPASQTNAGVESETASSEAESVPVVSDDPNIVGQQKGSVFVYGDRALELVYRSDNALEYYSRMLKEYKEALGPNVTVYNMVVPKAIEFYLPERYQNVSTPQKPMIDQIYQNNGDSIKNVNVYDILSRKRNEYIYYRTDHHWTALGAYYAYTEFAKAAGFEPVDINTLEKKSIPDFLGTLYKDSGNDPAVGANPDTVDYYKIPGNRLCKLWEKGKTGGPISVDLIAEFAKGSNAYSAFIWGDNRLMTISTEHNNGRKIAVIKESFGNAFVPFLAANYQEIHVVDFRYFDQGNLLKYLKDNGINEVLFLSNITTANNGGHVKKMEYLLQNG
jgi:hypothetical protein